MKAKSNRLKQFFKIKPFNIFIIVGFIAGGMMLIITPPFQVPDADNHFLRIYQLSRGNISGIKQAEDAGGFIPQNMIDVKFDFSNIRFQKDGKVKKQQVLYYLTHKLPPSEEIFVSFKNTVLYSPLAYLPQVTGVFIANILNLPPLWMLYLGRFFALIAYLFIVGISIRFIPVYKWGMVLLALMPMTLFQAASLSADSMTFAISFLLTAYILHLAFSKKEISRKDIIITCLLSFCIGLCKSSYVLIPFLFTIIPVKKFVSKKVFFISCLCVCFSVILSTGIWSLYVKDIYVPMYSYINPHEQLGWILAHPVQYMNVLIDVCSSSGYLLDEFVGVLGWPSVWPSVTLGMLPKIYLIVLFLCAILESDSQIKVSVYSKIVSVFIFLFSLLLITTMIYLSWCEIGAEMVDGLQGRYYIPIALLSFIVFYNHKLSSFFKNLSKYNIFIVFFFMAVWGYTLFKMVERYY
jgi:uncharacterized membrane protein